MKLNPFNKKSSAYYDKVKTEYDKLDREMTAAKDQLNEAEADFERKRRRQFELDQHGSMYSSTREQSQASFATSEASNRVSHTKGEIGQLESRIGPLRRIALAPSRFARAKQAFDDLVAQKLATTGELEKANALIAKVSKRVIDVDARIVTEFLVDNDLGILKVFLRVFRALFGEDAALLHVPLHHIFLHGGSFGDTLARALSAGDNADCLRVRLQIFHCGVQPVLQHPCHLVPVHRRAEHDTRVRLRVISLARGTNH